MVINQCHTKNQSKSLETLLLSRFVYALGYTQPMEQFSLPFVRFQSFVFTLVMLCMCEWVYTMFILNGKHDTDISHWHGFGAHNCEWNSWRRITTVCNENEKKIYKNREKKYLKNKQMDEKKKWTWDRTNVNGNEFNSKEIVFAFVQKNKRKINNFNTICIIYWRPLYKLFYAILNRETISIRINQMYFSRFVLFLFVFVFAVAIDIHLFFVLNNFHNILLFSTDPSPPFTLMRAPRHAMQRN